MEPQSRESQTSRCFFCWAPLRGSLRSLYYKIARLRAPLAFIFYLTPLFVLHIPFFNNYKAYTHCRKEIYSGLTFGLKMLSTGCSRVFLERWLLVRNYVNYLTPFMRWEMYKSWKCTCRLKNKLRLPVVAKLLWIR